MPTLLCSIAKVAAAAPGETRLVSVSANSTQGMVRAGQSLSGDGQLVVFSSEASDIVPGDANGVGDVFVRDVEAGTTTRVSVGVAGAEANGISKNAAISANGRYVAFESRASNLVPGDANGVSDIFVRDLVAGTTTRVSLSSAGTEGNDHSLSPSLSSDGLVVAFESRASNLVVGDANAAPDVFVRDRSVGTTRRVSVSSLGAEANGFSNHGVVSDDGQTVAFVSGASNLVVGDTNSFTDVFLHDLTTAMTIRVSVDMVGAHPYKNSSNPSVSSDGRFVAFQATGSLGDELPTFETASDVFVRDVANGTTIWASVSSWSGFGAFSGFGSFDPAISGDGRWIVFASQGSIQFNGSCNNNVCSVGYTIFDVGVFVRDLVAASTTRVSIGGDNYFDSNHNANPSISDDGRFVVFASQVDNLVPGVETDEQAWGVYLRDRAGASMSVVSSQFPRTGSSTSAVARTIVTNGAGGLRSVSADGSRVAFWSGARDLGEAIIGTAGVYVRDFGIGSTRLESYAGARSGSTDVAISADGRFVAFASSETNQPGGPVTGFAAIFVRNESTNTLTCITPGGNGGSNSPSISADGRYVTFESAASNLVVGDTNGKSDIFVWDMESGLTIRASVDSNGAQGNEASTVPVISDDGRHVAFQSSASNLVPGDTNAQSDIFVRDLDGATTVRASVSSAAVQAVGGSFYPTISAGGHFVAFQSTAANLVAGDSNGVVDVFVRDLLGNSTFRASVSSTGSQGNADSLYPSISADGRILVFQSAASNLVLGDTNNGASDIFVRELVNGTTTRASVATSGAQANNNSKYPAVSADGRHVVFQSSATNLAPIDLNGADDVFVHEVEIYGDADGDGLDDVLEAALGTSPLDPDSDSDGYQDGIEFAALTSPLDPLETPCGNGRLEAPEACDDERPADGDGCTSTCQIEAGFQCGGQPSVCVLPASVPALPGFAAVALIAILGATGVSAARQMTK